MKNIIFIHIPKCGGNSIQEAFAKALEDRKDVQFIKVGHMNVSHYFPDCNHKLTVDYVNDENTLFFTIGRNPYDRFISAYFYERKLKTDILKYKDINDYALHIADYYPLTFWRQVWYLDRHDRLKNFKFFKLENLQELKDYFKTNYKLDLDIPVVNKGDVKADPDILSREAIEKINNRYHNDFAFFGYWKIDPSRRK